MPAAVSHPLPSFLCYCPCGVIASCAESLYVCVLHSSFVTLYNYYGPTEASVYATGKHVLRDQLPGRLASIGKPLPNVTCYVSHTHGTRDTRTRESCSAIGEDRKSVV